MQISTILGKVPLDLCDFLATTIAMTAVGIQVHRTMSGSEPKRELVVPTSHQDY